MTEECCGVCLAPCSSLVCLMPELLVFSIESPRTRAGHQRLRKCALVVLMLWIAALAAVGYWLCASNLSFWKTPHFSLVAPNEAFGGVTTAVVGCLMVLPYLSSCAHFPRRGVFYEQHKNTCTALVAIVSLMTIVLLSFTVLLCLSVAVDTGSAAMQAGIELTPVINGTVSTDDYVMNDSFYDTWVNSSAFRASVSSFFSCCGFNATFPDGGPNCTLSKPFCQPQVVATLEWRSTLLMIVTTSTYVGYLLVLMAVVRLLYGRFHTDADLEARFQEFEREETFGLLKTSSDSVHVNSDSIAKY